MYTATAELEKRQTAGNFVEVLGARSWSSSSITYDSLYVFDATGLDSTMYYWCSDYMGIQAKAIGDNDSCKVNLLVFDGHMRPSIVDMYKTSSGLPYDTNSFLGFENVAKDSLVITKSGWTNPKQLAIPPSKHFYIRADGQTDNGHTTKIIVRMYRYGEIAK
jgi:hypothetical protein